MKYIFLIDCFHFQRKLRSIVKDLKEHPDIQEIYDVLEEYTNENEGDDAESPVSAISI